MDQSRSLNTQFSELPNERHISVELLKNLAQATI